LLLARGQGKEVIEIKKLKNYLKIRNYKLKILLNICLKY